MTIFDEERDLPVGWEEPKIGAAVFLGHFISGLTLLRFTRRLYDALDGLYTYVQKGDNYIRVVDTSRVMTPFRELISGFPLLGLWCYLAAMPLLVWRYYHYHTEGSMSVYTMRRLPNKWEYHRRCWKQPILSAIAELLFYAILIGLCWFTWRNETPAACLPM